jgi:hypothetical protein
MNSRRFISALCERGDAEILSVLTARRIGMLHRTGRASARAASGSRALRIALMPELQFSLKNLRLLRATVDALLNFLPSDSSRE